MREKMCGVGGRGGRAWVPLLGLGVALAAGLALAACSLTGPIALETKIKLPGKRVIAIGLTIGPDGAKTYDISEAHSAPVCLEFTWSDSTGEEISSETVELPASGQVPAEAVRWEAWVVNCPDEGDVTGAPGPPAMGGGVRYRRYQILGGPVTGEPGASDPSRHASYSFWVEARDAAAAAALVAPIVAGGPGTPVSAAVEVLFYNTLVPTPGGALLVTAVREPFGSYRLDWNGKVGYGDLASGHNATLVSLPNDWWAVQSIVLDSDFDDDPSTPGVDYRNTAELEFSVPSAGVRTASAEVVHRYL